MSLTLYDYSNRQGVVPMLCDAFHAICKGLAAAVAPFDPPIILAVGWGGFYPGTLLAHLLRAEVFPVRLTRRVKEKAIAVGTLASQSRSADSDFLACPPAYPIAKAGG